MNRLLTLLACASLTLLCLFDSTAAPQDPAGKTAPTIFMIGDSTMANKPLQPAQPERGWGQLLALYFKPVVQIENLAVNGRSSKSFRDEGRWKPVLERLHPGDFVIIQFGHNDEKADERRHTEPYGSFKENLTRYVRETRERQGTPILATPIVRRAFTNETELTDTHGDYAVAVRQVATEQAVPLLDLQKVTERLVLQLGQERSKKLFMWVEPGEYASTPAGKEDNTHLNPYGATRVCDLAVEEIRTHVLPLAEWLK